MKYYPMVSSPTGSARREVVTDVLLDGSVVTLIAPATAPAAHRALVVYFREPDGSSLAVLVGGARYGEGVYTAQAERVEVPTSGWCYTVDGVGREVANALSLTVPDPSPVGRASGYTDARLGA